MGSLLLSKLAQSALDLILPIYCAGCGREGGVLCEECTQGLARLDSPHCTVCSGPGVTGLCRWCAQFPPGFDSLRAPYLFDGAIREAIHRLKYKNERAAGRLLGGLLANYFERQPTDADVLVPVPLHRKRLRSRGYNQSALLARDVGKRLDIAVGEELLVRSTDSRPQVEARSRDERRDNVAGNFDCVGDVSGLAIVVVDDVATTGSTLSECAEALKGAGATSVHSICLARES